MVAPAAIIAGIETAGALAESISSMSEVIPDAPTDLQGKARWLTMTVFNQTQYDLVYQGSYFDSGRFWTAPTNVPPFKEMTFSGCDSDGSFMTGVSGGVQFTIAIPNSPQTFAVGFSNPWSGALKASVVAGSGATAQAAYDKIDNATISVKTPTFSGTDSNGKPVQLSFLLVSEPGQEASVTVTEQVSGD